MSCDHGACSSRWAVRRRLRPRRAADQRGRADKLDAGAPARGASRGHDVLTGCSARPAQQAQGIVRDIALRPGQAVRVKDAVVRLRACETTAPWESEALTGAFVQLDVELPDGRWQRAFSGWLYKESPSLNVIEHPVYDVTPKSCAMTYPAGAAAPARR